MQPRWGRVLSHLNRINNLPRRNDFVSRGSPAFSFRRYAKVATAAEPSVDSTEKLKPEVNLNKMFWSKPCSLALAADSPYRMDTPQYDGIKKFMLKLMLFYSKQSQYIRWSHAHYRRVIDQVDKPAIYDVFSLEKTFHTTFSLLVIHMWLVLRRLKEEGKEGVELGQYLYEIYNHDLELRVSKAGVNLLLTKWMKECESIFYGNVVAYDAAMGKQDELQNVIWRNVFFDESSSPSKPSEAALLPVQAMARYVRREASCLALTDKEAIMSGNFMFTPLKNMDSEEATK